MRADVKFRKPQADPSDCKRAICNAIPIYLSFANREYPGVQTSDGWHGGCQCREAESEAKPRVSSTACPPRSPWPTVFVDRTGLVPADPGLDRFHFFPSATLRSKQRTASEAFLLPRLSTSSARSAWNTGSTCRPYVWQNPSKTSSMAEFAVASDRVLAICEPPRASSSTYATRPRANAALARFFFGIAALSCVFIWAAQIRDGLIWGAAQALSQRRVGPVSCSSIQLIAHSCARLTASASEPKSPRSSD